MLRNIGFIACSDEVAFRDDREPNSNEHTVLGLEIISGLNDELVDAVVRYHHSTLKSNDYPTQGMRCSISGPSPHGKGPHGALG